MKLIDLTGKQFEHLLVIERDFQTQKDKNSRDVFWKCRCDCGNELSVRGQDLRQLKTKSCGCLKKENAHKINYINMIGQRFGRLLVLQEAKERIDNHVCWICQCDCGNQSIVMGKHLRSGATKSCGCLKSQGELKISEILKMNSIRFETQKTFNNCKNQLLLKFDFYLPDYQAVIEYNGIQHYKAIDFFGGEERFEQQKLIDAIKKDWCYKNNIIFVEIPYEDYKKIDFNYLINKIKGENK